MKKISTISITIDQFDQAVNLFDETTLSSELSSFIETKCSCLPLANNLVLNIAFSGSINDKEKLANIIHGYYHALATYSIYLDKKNDFKRLFLLIVGIIFILVSRLNTFSVLEEILLISGWVAVWEMFYDLLFGEGKRKKDVKRYRALATSEINFI